MSQFTKLSQVYIAAGVAMNKCEEAGVEFGFKLVTSGWVIEDNGNSLYRYVPEAILIPVGIVEGRKVFIGDELSHPEYGKVKVAGGDWDSTLLCIGSLVTGWISCEPLSWREPKLTVNINGKEVARPYSVQIFDDRLVLLFETSNVKAFSDALGSGE